MGALLQLGLGALFGIALFTSGAADFDAMLRMFHFEEVHLFALAAVTTLVAWLGLGALSRSRAGEGVRMLARPVHAGSISGGVVFGVGWGLSGSCPGTALAQLGSGHVISLVTVGGVLLGNWIFERWLSGRFGLTKNSCN